MDTVASGVQLVLARVRPRTVDALDGWLRAVLGIEVPRRGVCAGHGSPMDYLEHVFFERPGDVIVWANRGGGKTFYGAVATLLDLVFKPGIEVRILGGSFEQSRKMYGYLRWMLDRPGLRPLLAGGMTGRGLRLGNGSGVELLAQSQASVRGHRVQKLRCDEVELFDREVWEAAQYVTRSAVCGGVEVRGAVEVFSTMHRPFGLMSELVDEAGPRDCYPSAFDGEGSGLPGGSGWKLVRWCAMDVMGRCGEERVCEGCGLWEPCGGRAKGWGGFLPAGDVIDQRRRGSRGTFESEMLCLRPSRSDAVYPMFDASVHVRAIEPSGAGNFGQPGNPGSESPGSGSGVWVGGMDFGMRSPFVMLWARVGEAEDGSARVEVVDEYVRSDRTLGEHLGEIGRREWPRPAWLGVDPAGHQRSEQTGRSTIGVLREEGYKVRANRRPLAEGIESVRRLMEPTDPGRPSGVGLVIHPRCVKLIESLTCYHFDADRPWRQEPVKDGHDHAADALRYLVLNLPRAGGGVTVRGY